MEESVGGRMSVSVDEGEVGGVWRALVVCRGRGRGRTVCGGDQRRGEVEHRGESRNRRSGGGCR